MTRLTRLIVTLLITLGLSSIAVAKHHAGEPGLNNDRIMHKMSQKLDLSEDQSAQLQQVLDKMTDFHQSRAHARLPMSAENMQQLLSTDRFDQAKASQLVEQRIDEMRAHSAQMIPLIAQFTDSLEPQQRVKLSHWLEKKGNHVKRHRAKKAYNEGTTSYNNQN